LLASACIRLASTAKPSPPRLMSYAVNFYDQCRRAAAYVDQILKGAKPGDLPVQQPTKFEFIINLKTARALDLSVAPQLLALADETIR
jgi:putative tryptophan/tyrosine transport system substrate-binding protein